MTDSFGMYLIFGAIAGLIIVKEVAEYQLPSTHWLNRFFNTPDRKHSECEYDNGWDSGWDGD